MKEAFAAGVSPYMVEDWTWGELVSAITAYGKRRGRELKNQATIAYRHAGLVATLFAGKRGTQPPEVYEVFPFWTDEEVRELQLSKYRQFMRKQVAAGRRSKS